MRAISQQRFGGTEVLTLVETDPPQPRPSEVLVRVEAIGVNPVDSLVRAGTIQLLDEPPFVLGWDVSGVVEQSIPGPGRFAPGDEVYGLIMFPRAGSAYAEYVAAPSRMFARKPVGLTFVEAAALPLVGLTAWQGMVEYGRLSAGQRVLVHAAGGGVGHVAVQLAKARGAYVIATASAGKHDFVRGLGADEVIDYRQVDFTEVVRDMDLVLDPAGHGTGTRSLSVLRPGGTLVTVVEHFDTALRARAEAAGFRFFGMTVEPDGTGLEQLTALVDKGLLRPQIDTVLPLAEAAKAHELVDSGHTTGKIVLTP